MSHLRAFFLLFFFIFFSASCSTDFPPETKRTLIKFGTLIDITLYDVEPSLAQKALDQIEANFDQYHADWTSWQESPLTKVNEKLALGQPAQLQPSLIPLIKKSQALSEISYELFNPGINRLIRLWQFHRSDDPEIQPPDPESILKWLQKKPSMDDLELDGQQLHSKNPNVQLNFGAFAKGYAIDLSFDYLQSLGINNAVINAGGDLSVRGQHGTRPWKIGIRHPRADSVIAWLEVFDKESVFTSGDYERFYLYEGKRYHHILDPRTGYPARDTTSVTVIHKNAGTADAAATALFVAGPEQWGKIAKSMNIKYVMLIDHKGTIYMTPAMAERIHFSQDQSGNIQISNSL